MTEQIKSAFRQLRRDAAAFWMNTIHARTVQIGLTGSYGKTSTTHAICAVLSAHGSTLATDVNLDTIYNLPITALKLRNHRYVVLELGIDSLNEMSFHLEIARPHIGIITGIAPVHADAEHLGSVENIIREKRKLIEALSPEQRAILHRDDSNVRDMATHTRAQVLWYGLTPESDYHARDIVVGLAGTSFTAITPQGEFSVETRLLGRHNVTNMMAAAAVGIELGIPVETIQTAFTTLEPLRGRLNIEEGPLGLTLINDALRANTASTRAGLAFLDDLAVEGSKIAVLGEMGEIGETAVEEHQKIGAYIATLGVDTVVCVGGLTRHIAEAAVAAGAHPAQTAFVETVQDAADLIRGRAAPGDVLYVKGSLLRHLERVVLLLDGWEVGCSVASCPFYHQCTECQYRVVGYMP